MKFFERPLLIALAISAALLSIVVMSPLSVDNFIYQSIALDLYRAGRIPYLGSWDQNFPGIIVIHYMGILLFGQRDLSIRLMDVLLQLGFGVLFYKFCRMWLRPRVAAIAVVLYIFYYVTGRGSIYSERDVYGVMAVVAGIYFVFRWRGRRVDWELLLAGLFAGFSILIRPTFGLAYVLIGIFLWSLLTSYKGFWTRWRPVLIYGIFGAVPMLFFLLVYAMIPGGLYAVYMATIRFNLDVYTKYNGAPELWSLLGIFVFFLWRGFLIPFAAIGFLALRSEQKPALPRCGLLRWPEKRERLLYGSLLISFLFITIIQRKYLAYQFAPFYLLLCPLSAVGVEWALERIRGWFSRTAIVLVVLTLYGIFMVGDRREIAGFTQALIEGKNPWNAAYAEHHFSASFGAVPQREVLNFLSMPGNDTGSIEVCSYEPALRTHLNRNFASPYVMPTAIAWTADGGSSLSPQYTDYQIAWRKAYLDSLCQSRPQFIILARNTVCWYLIDPYRTYLHNLPGFDSLLQTSYRYDTAFGCFQIFRRKG